MECNDGARKMERTEQLHNIHQQLDFHKLKVSHIHCRFHMYVNYERERGRGEGEREDRDRESERGQR